ncbi:glycosyltransferase family 2 protein [Murimonas intestini]|uniref:Glycosyltransferase EpsH n=1 Tax=Murimonas intestini TaxID=1337051 RepID=A0AB73T6B0_9FIRM|nr:glycosyltransferase family 2 protein [Murimonas intestini]MCR1839604.1 glycosyltransferase family 2 protein [Murimonas intestini]MCR1866447.1 glycosyltransferase family 2 protein [Murimonas intestini]MCR1882435.1 glycosyltransferase family 2 protein [Murimonas intestini]
MKKENPLISIIVPVYNAEKYIRECLVSIITQTYKNLEIICVNDNSSDASQTILDEFKKKDSRICVIKQQKQGGVSLARNKALQIATGEYIMFLDSDDWIDKETCKEVLDIALAEEIDVVMWGYVREFGDVSKPKSFILEEKNIYGVKECQEKLHRRFVGLLNEELAHPELADVLCPVWGKLYRSTFIKNNHIQFEDLKKIGTYEDGLFNLYVFQYIKSAVYLNRHYYHYRKQKRGSITSHYNPCLAQQWQQLYNIMENYIIREKLDIQYRQALNNRISLGILGLGINITGSSNTIWEQIGTIKHIINEKLYRDSVKTLTLKYFPFHWKIFYGCAKYNFSIGIYILLLFIKKYIGR